MFPRFLRFSGRAIKLIVLLYFLPALHYPLLCGDSTVGGPPSTEPAEVHAGYPHLWLEGYVHGPLLFSVAPIEISLGSKCPFLYILSRMHLVVYYTIGGVVTWGSLHPPHASRPLITEVYRRERHIP